MQILFNELSLEGQFHDQDDFVKIALLPFIAILKEMESFSQIQIQTKNDAWQRKITPVCNLHSFIVQRPPTDEARRLKLAISRLVRGPFWDCDSKQHQEFTYLLNGSDVKGSSPAEACERDKILVSFLRSQTSSDPLIVERNGKNIELLNLYRRGMLLDHLWETNQVSFEIYLKTRFSSGKLDFSEVDNKKMGFSTISTSQQSSFISSFDKFEKLSWTEVQSDSGLRYKEYKGIFDARFIGKTTYKFRASRKYRCHGYRSNDFFVVIGFELDHKKSDQG